MILGQKLNAIRWPKSLKERFEDKIFPEPNTGCWLWGAYTDKKGYGQFGKGKEVIRAHRISFELYKGEIPEGLHVLHICDIPSCVNPDHLFLGTNLENVEDKVKKGRSCIGVRAGKRTKLDDNWIKIIREAFELGYSQTDIGKYFGMKSSSISCICRRINWKHL